MGLLRNFQELDKNDTDIAGGKGASLGEMTQAGILVPNGFVVLAPAFEKFLEETDLNTEIDTILHSVNHKEIHTIESASEKIEALILDSEIPQDIAQEIQKFFKKLGARYVAVRSSATAEDSASAAWAGQLESFLNTTEKNLLENVKKCWASLFTPRAIFYRFEKNLHKQKISVAVVVQKMVESEKSGVAFSVHPVTQDKNQLIIEAGYGLGEAIVSGQITPNSYVVEKQPRRIIDKNIQIQTKGLYRAKNGGNEWRNIPKQQGGQQVLSDGEILKLSELILKIETHYGFPCDIEWALEDGTFFITQSRPITTLTKRISVPEKNVFSDSSFAKKLLTLSNYELILRREFDFVPIIAEHVLEGYKLVEEFSGAVFSDMLYIYDGVFVYSLRKNGEMERFAHILRNAVFKRQDDFLKIIQKAKSGLEKLEQQFYSPDVDVIGKFLKAHKEFTKYYIFLWLVGLSLGDDMDLILKNSLDDFNKIRNSTLFTTSIYSFFPKEKHSDLTSLFPREIINYYKGKSYVGRDKGIVISLEKNKLIYERNMNSVWRFIKKIEEIQNQKAGENKNLTKIQGVSAYKGIVRGKVKIILKKSELLKVEDGDIMVAEMTTPEYMVAVKKASAIITDEGGITCHAAIIARELEMPCIIGTKIATHVLRDNMEVEVDADNGIVKIMEN